MKPGEHKTVQARILDYDDLTNNVYEVTEEWAYHNGHYGTREDVVFLINGIPVLVIECKNANKDEELNKYILRQHQTGAVEVVVKRALDPNRRRRLTLR